MKVKIALIAAVLVLAGIVWIVAQRNTSPQFASPAPAASQVVASSTMIGDKQLIAIFVNEGYQPKEFTAKAGVPVVLSMKTKNTFDCSTAFSIPKLGIQARLESTGESTFNIPAQKAGDSLQGVCGMGMYGFVIKFL